MRTMKAVLLVEDFALYPRVSVDSQHVKSLRLAMQAGIVLPPIIVESKSFRIIDGFHRRRAALAEYGKDATVSVAVKKYNNEKELVLDAIKYNSSHGRNLSAYDRTHCAINAVDQGIDKKIVAQSLNVKVEWVNKALVERTATVGDNIVIPLKRTVIHMVGKKLTEVQYEAMPHLGGHNQLFYVNQLVRLFETDLVDKNNANLILGLNKLGKLIHKHIAN